MTTREPEESIGRSIMSTQLGGMIALLVVMLGAATVVRCEEGQQGQRAAPLAEGVCGDGDMFTLSVNRRLNRSSGEWSRTFYARRVDEEKSNPGLLELEATQGTAECGGKTTTHIRVVVREIPENGTKANDAEKEDRLRFHPRHGKNAVILNDGRSAQKLDLDDNLNAVLFTHRPLRNGELFEVRLDKRIVKNNYCFALGIMAHSPDEVKIKASMHELNDGTWVYHNNAIYGSARELSKFGPDLNKIQASDRLGVMRKEDGSIHYFMNGADLGRAVANVPEPVYGVFELWYDAIKATIVY